MDSCMERKRGGAAAEHLYGGKFAAWYTKLE